MKKYFIEGIKSTLDMAFNMRQTNSGGYDETILQNIKIVELIVYDSDNIDKQSLSNKKYEVTWIEK